MQNRRKSRKAKYSNQQQVSKQKNTNWEGKNGKQEKREIQSILLVVFEGVQAFAIVFVALAFFYTQVQEKRQLDRFTVDYLNSIASERVKNGFIAFQGLQNIGIFVNDEDERLFELPFIGNKSENYKIYEDLRHWVRYEFDWPIAEYVGRLAFCLELKQCDRNTAKTHSCYLISSIPRWIAHIAELSPRINKKKSVYDIILNSNFCDVYEGNSFPEYASVAKLIEMYESSTKNSLPFKRMK